jgi:hypothetical protein
MWSDLLYNSLLKHFSFPEDFSDVIIINLHTSSCKVSIILVRFILNLKFLNRASKNTEISNFMTIRQVGAELLHVDRHTDMTKLTAVLHNFAKTPQKTVNTDTRPI